jgi:regulator of protease activity HflC (stomatin/prohibitin superfamily)
MGWFVSSKQEKDRYGDMHTSYSINYGRIGLTVFAVLVLLPAAFGWFFTVPAGSVGVVTRLGAVNRVTYPGFNTKMPFIEGVVRMNIQTQKDEVDASAASKDLQAVKATIAVNYSLDPSSAATVYQTIGVGFKDTILSPIVQNAFKATTAGYTAEELITKREEVRSKAETMIMQQAAPYHILVKNFLIENFDFSPEFNAAIEAKQVAQQQVETAKQKLAQAQVDAQTAAATAKGQGDANVAIAKGNADATVLQAQAQAQANTLITQSLSPQLLQYQYITKLAPGVQTIFVPSGNQFILPLPNTTPTGQ